MNLSVLTQGWRLKSLIKPGSYLAPRFWGGGGGKETMTFQTTSLNMWAHFLHSACREGVVGCVARGIASFSTRCRLGWQSFPNILKIAPMTSMHWPHQHFELLAHPKMHNLLQAVDWLKQKFVGPGLQDYMCWLGPCWLWIDGGTNLQLHENVVNAEMDQEKKTQG